MTDIYGNVVYVTTYVALSIFLLRFLNVIFMDKPGSALCDVKPKREKELDKL